MNLRERKKIWERYSKMQLEMQRDYLVSRTDLQRVRDFEMMAQQVRERRPDYLKTFYDSHEEALRDSHLRNLIADKRRLREIDERMK